MKISPKRVFVMMSGGVDSSVATLLLSKNKKYEVIGCFIRGYNIDGCQEVDAEDARRVAGFLKIPFYVLDLEKEYKKLVVDYMINGYKKGTTPNPDVMCNKKIKFGLFLEKALEMGADYIASGHHVRLATSHLGIGYKKHKNKTLNPIGYTLFTARDSAKDQSYFLWTLTQEQLKHCLFPIGDYLKSEVREIAKKAGLPTAEKKDSQGICFLGMVKFRDFLKQYLPRKKGDILDINGKKIGEHEGAWFYTIGQRHIGIMNYAFAHGKSPEGLLGIIGIRGKHEIKPFYVVKKNIKKNILTVAERENNRVLYKKEIKLMNVNFIRPIINHQLPIAVYARIRYRQPLTPVTLIYADNMQINADIKKKNPRKSVLKSAFIRVLFEKPQKAVAPGQSAVFYNSKGEMLGGGIIV